VCLIDKGPNRTMLDRILDDIHDVLRNYIRALVLLSIASFCAWAIFLSVLRYPYRAFAGRCFSRFRVYTGDRASCGPGGFTCCLSRDGDRRTTLDRDFLDELPRAAGLRIESLPDEYRDRDTSTPCALRSSRRGGPGRRPRDVFLRSAYRNTAAYLRSNADSLTSPGIRSGFTASDTSESDAHRHTVGSQSRELSLDASAIPGLVSSHPGDCYSVENGRGESRVLNLVHGLTTFAHAGLRIDDG